MKREIWKSIPEYKGLYDVSNLGRVRRACDSCFYKKGDVLQTHKSVKGYLRVYLMKNSKEHLCTVHQLVLFAFTGPRPEGLLAAHLNDIKADNRLENLAWMTNSENIKLAYEHGRMTRKGKNNPMYGKHHSKKTKRKISKALVGNENWKGIKK